MSAKTQAKRAAGYLIRGDDYICLHERAFDSLWEQGNGDEVAAHFKVLYDSDLYLQQVCRYSRYFSPDMVKPLHSEPHTLTDDF